LDIHYVKYKNSKGWLCNNFPLQFHFFLGAIHEKHNFEYFKNPMVKVCKIWCNYVYMYILYSDIFWWKLIDRIFFNEIFNTRVVSQGIPPFSQFQLFCTWLSPNRIFIYIHISSVVMILWTCPISPWNTYIFKSWYNGHVFYPLEKHIMSNSHNVEDMSYIPLKDIYLQQS
jgi:hypothetical protein